MLRKRWILVMKRYICTNSLLMMWLTQWFGWSSCPGAEIHPGDCASKGVDYTRIDAASDFNWGCYLILESSKTVLVGCDGVRLEELEGSSSKSHPRIKVHWNNEWFELELENTKDLDAHPKAIWEWNHLLVTDIEWKDSDQNFEFLWS